MTTRDGASSRIGAYLGLAAAASALGGVALSMALSPRFSLSRHALSDLGASGAVTAPLFNGGLLVGGALGLGFVAAVWTETAGRVRLAGLLVLAAATAFMALVGVFPLPHPLHGAVAVPFFVCLTVGVVLWGAGDYAAGRPNRGLAFLALAALHVVAWACWILFAQLPRGIAVPELVGSATLGAWVVWVAVDECR